MSDKLHAVYDYILSIFVVLLPWIFGFYHSRTATEVTMIFGAVNFLDALLTGHKGSLFHKAPMYFHLGVDCVWAVMLALAPWFFNFSNVVWLPHVIIGLLVAVVSLSTHLPEEEQGKGDISNF